MQVPPQPARAPAGSAGHVGGHGAADRHRCRRRGDAQRLRVRVVYNQLDWLALWYVEDYFDLDPAQETQAKQMIGRTISWHRETQLPRYASLTRTLLLGITPPADPIFLAERYAEIVTLWDDLLRQVAPDFSVLLQSLTDEQVIDLFENLADENRELKRITRASFAGSGAPSRTRPSSRHSSASRPG